MLFELLASEQNSRRQFSKTGLKILSRIIFLRRTSACKDLSFFAYMVVAECWNVTPKNEIRMFDFVQRIRSVQ